MSRFAPDTDRAADLVGLVPDPMQRTVIIDMMRDGDGLPGEELAVAVVLLTGTAIAGDVTGFRGSDSEAAQAARRRALWLVAAAMTVTGRVVGHTGVSPEIAGDPAAGVEATLAGLDGLAALAGQTGEAQDALITAREHADELGRRAERLPMLLAENDDLRRRVDIAEGQAGGVSPRWAREALEHLRDQLGRGSYREVLELTDRLLKIVTEMEGPQ